MSYFIRKGTVEDFPYLVIDMPDIQYSFSEFVLANDTPSGWLHVTPNLLSFKQRKDTTHVFIAEYASKIVGLLWCRGKRYEQNKHTCIVEFYVAKEHRNQGVATLLVEEALSWIKKNELIMRAEVTILSENEIARHLLQKKGFAIEGELRNSVSIKGQVKNAQVLAWTKT